MSVADRKAQVVEMWTGVAWADVAAFIGPNAERFRTVWEKQRAMALAGRGGIVWSLSWPALLFSFAWFFYRKMWLNGALLVVIPALLTAVFSIPAPAFGGVGIALAMAAKSLYVQTIIPRIARLKRQGDGDAAALAIAGGASLAAGLIAGLVYAVAVAAVAATAFG